MSRDWRGRFGALQEREFRLLFSATTITTAGDRLAGIALAFAVIDIGTATDLGLVFAARQGTQALVVLFGGVLSDRLPRNRVLAGAALVQGVSQVGTAAVVLGSAGGVWAIVALQAAWGIGQGVVIPAEVGLVPQTVSAARLQQANALQGLSRNVVGVLGPAVGGVIVVATSPGFALAVDAVSFFVCAELLRRIRVTGRMYPDGQKAFFAELRDGWREFTSRTWLWASVILFGLGNLALAGWQVLGPVVADADLGGAGPWAAVLVASGIGAIGGSVIAIRIRPTRPLVWCVLAAVPLSFQSIALALLAPVWVIATAAFIAGAGLSVHLTLWFTVFQQQVPAHAQSRVSAYDTLGSFVLMPLGFVIVGPLSDAIGTSETLWCAVALMWVTWIGILALPSVWAIRRRPPTAESIPAGV
jgi:MFS family permease